MSIGPIDLALRVAAILDRLEIPYVVGGSLASSMLGEPRATADIDVAIRLTESDVAPLVEALGPEYYVSPEAAVAAVRRKGSFNLVHLESVQKVDLFVLGDELLEGVANVGTRPTVDSAGKTLLEVFIFDFDRDIYGEHLDVHFIARLRDELKFPDLDSMIVQMHKDVAQAKAVLAADG